jgi:tRNA dimethylallyltransferase
MLRPRVLALVGLTGTGKTEIACEIARRVGGEILGADSVQVYRGMDIGTAKPSAALRREIPHHGIDLVDPDDEMSAGRWAAIARAAARGAHARGRRVILCGGTGLYARAFSGGLVPGVGADPRLRAELRERTTAELCRELERIDPEAARRIHRNDRVRIERAIEVTRLGGRTITAQHGEHGFADAPFELRWLGLELEREELWQRLRSRVDRMFEQGLVDEVRGLYARGYGPELRPLQALGYREVGELLAGRLGESQAREATFLSTRRYAKRQRTWFRGQAGLRWYDARSPELVLDAAVAWLEAGSGEVEPVRS